MTTTTDMVLHNQGQPDGFGYQVAFVKQNDKTYSLTQFATEINIYESLFAKAVCCTVGVFDGAGLMEKLALQPGDGIDVTLMKDEDSKKVTKRFVILSIDQVQRTGNSQAKTYRVSGITAPAFLNKKNTVYRGFKGTHSEMVKTLCADYLGLTEVEIEETYGDFLLASPGKTPFKLLSQIMLHAISAARGEAASLFFFYEDRDGHKFKTLSSVLEDAETHKMSVSIDKNVDGVPDLSKIHHFVQLKAGSQSERMAAGMYENEVLEFDHMSRAITSRKWTFKESGKALQALGKNPVVDMLNNLDEWTSDAEKKARGLANLVKVRSADEAFDSTNNYTRKFGPMVAQKAMFNQIIYAVQIFGNTNIKVGDLLEITAPALHMQGDAPELDFSLAGKFLVGDVRHRIVNGEQFLTILNIFKDGYETAYQQESEK